MSKNGMSMHAYDKNGVAHHWVPRATGRGSRPTTIADLRANNWLPGVTEVIKILDKPALVNWRIKQAVMAVATAPDVPGEALDAKLHRVLEVEEQQDEESRMARDLGEQIHAAMQLAFEGGPISESLKAWIMPAIGHVKEIIQKPLAVEQVLVGDGYAGRCDLIAERQGYVCDLLLDWKSAKTLPDPARGGAWRDHQLQLAAYAAAHRKQQAVTRAIRTANVYISTLRCGEFVYCEHGPWEPTYQNGFLPLLKVWQWWHDYTP